MSLTYASIYQSVPISPHGTDHITVSITSWPGDPHVQWTVLSIGSADLVKVSGWSESAEFGDNRSALSPGLLYLKNFAQAGGETSKQKALHYITPTTAGYVVRSDFLQERMRGCAGIEAIEEFVIPAQYLAGISANSDSNLLELLQSSAGVLVTGDVVESQGSRDRSIPILHQELYNRLSWPWLLSQPLGTKRVAVIGEKRTPQECERFYSSASACGVNIVVFERPGHWMEDELGLASAPLAALRTVTNKYETRKLQATPTMLEVSSARELEEHLDNIERRLQFPVIVKPTRSSGSYGVSKVQTSAELVIAVKHALHITAVRNTKHFGINEPESTVIIESYCEGPEVDANFVLWDNNLLFFEVVDNFPCAGDSVGQATETEGFIETGSIWPSGIPQAEADTLRNELLDLIRALGFSRGVFHVEARMKNSSVEWQRDDHGVLHLTVREKQGSLQASTFLLEINPRAPGQSDSAGSAWANGVDYYALALMSVIGDGDRFRSLAHGFRRGPQFHCATTPLSIRCSGYLMCGIDLGTIAQQDEDIADSALELYSYFQEGEKVPAASERRLPWLGFIMLQSREGRERLLERLARAAKDVFFPVHAPT